MRFMLIVKATKDFEAGVWPDEKLLSEMANWTEEIVKAGARLDSGRLQPSSTGVRVRYANGKFLVTDGPFAETKELIAGFCLIRILGDYWHIAEFSVVAAKRRGGVGRLTVDELAEKARAAGATELEAKAHPADPGALPFWLAAGFEIVSGPEPIVTRRRL